MVLKRLDEQHFFSPLESYLEKASKNNWLPRETHNTIILSSIQAIDRNIVEQLEQMQVYDSDEFLSVQDELCNLIDSESFENTLSIVKDVISRKIKPTLNLDPSDNHGFIVIDSDSTINALSLLHGPLMFSWSNPISEGWIPIKYAFDMTMKSLEQPELLSCTFDSNFLSWIDVTDISTYLSGLDPLKNIYEQVEFMGFPIDPSTKNALEVTRYRVLKLNYLFNLCLENLNSRSFSS